MTKQTKGGGGKQQKLYCSTCPFILTAGDKNVGDTCPWCNKGKLLLKRL